MEKEKAIELFKAGYAPKILISGKSPFYEREKVETSEAEILAKFATERGVPEGSIILEKEALSVPDNAKRSLNLLEKESIPHRKIILANSPFSQRRGWAHFSKFSKPGTKLIRANAGASNQFSRDGWYHDKVGVQGVVKEFWGLRLSEILNTA
mgnify:FL=1